MTCMSVVDSLLDEAHSVVLPGTVRASPELLLAQKPVYLFPKLPAFCLQIWIWLGFFKRLLVT